MKNYFLALDRQIREGLLIGRKLSLPADYRKVKQILFCGMGGSAISGDILRVIVTQRSKDFFAVEHGSRWPNWADGQTLAVFSSYSGNTVEVLQHVHRAFASKTQMLMVTSGGHLGEIALERRLPCLRIPGGLPPRCAVGYLTFSVIPVLAKVGGFRITEEEIKETVSVIRKMNHQKAKAIARKLFKKAIHLYGVSGLVEPILVRWRAQLAENAKTLASHHVIPEIFHNEVEGWKFPRTIIKNSMAVFLNDREDPSLLCRKRKLVQNHIRGNGGQVLEINSQGRSPLARIFSLISLGDWVSYELASLNHVDPMSIPTIEAVKKVS